jgi:hypothetical protein
VEGLCTCEKVDRRFVDEQTAPGHVYSCMFA